MGDPGRIVDALLACPVLGEPFGAAHAVASILLAASDEGEALVDGPATSSTAAAGCLRRRSRVGRVAAGAGAGRYNRLARSAAVVPPRASMDDAPWRPTVDTALVPEGASASRVGVIFEFGAFELDEERWELRRGGTPVALQPRTLALLAYLVRARDRVVPREELLERLWPGVFVTESSLNRTVSLARLSIDDRGTQPSAILTVARRGYRFCSTVTVAGVSAARDGAGCYVGREALRARLEASLDAALGGRGRILLLAGEAGIGKTRTAELLLGRARESGADVAAAWEIEEEGAPTFAAWARIVRTLDAPAGRHEREHPSSVAAPLERLAPDLLREGASLRARSGSHGRQADRYALFEAVNAFLTSRASRRPVALVLDDLQWADAESLWLLEFIGHGLAALPIAVIATRREHEMPRPAEHTRAFAKLERLATLERWPLSGLSVPEISDFVRERSGLDAPPGLVDALARTSGGNPLLLEETVRSLAARDLLRSSRDADAWDALLPAGIRPLLLQELRGVSDAAREVLGCAAAIGVELTREVLARAVDRDEAVLSASLREAADAGLLAESSDGRLRFMHALVRDGLLAELAPTGPARRVLEARIAEALEAAGASTDEDVAERAYHACEGAPVFEPRRAADLARRAALRAARFHDFDGAARWYRRAIDVLGPDGGADPGARAELWLGLAEAHERTQGLDRARPLYRTAAELAGAAARDDLVARAALGFASRPDAGGAGDSAITAVLGRALRRADDAPFLRTRLLSRLAAELRYADRHRAEALVDEAIESARRLGDAATLARALDDASFVRFSPDDPEGWVLLNAEVVQAARAAGDLELEIAGHAGCWTGFLELGDLVGVDRTIAECEATVAALRTPLARWLGSAARAMRALLDGRLEAAEELIVASLRQVERAQSPNVDLQSLVQLVYLRSEQGRTGEVEAATRGRMQRFPDAPAWRAALAALFASAGRLDEARRELERVAGANLARVPRDRGWIPTLAFSAEVAHATHAVHMAEVLHPLLEPYARLCVVAGGVLFYGSVSHHLGLLAATLGRQGDAVSHLEQALRLHERMGARPWTARSEIALAEQLSCRGAPGDAERAADLAAGALATARALGLERIAASARRFELPELRAVPVV